MSYELSQKAQKKKYLSNFYLAINNQK